MKGADMQDGFDRRQELARANWPELQRSYKALRDLCLGGGELGEQLKYEVFTVASVAHGCRHCQAHGGYGLHLQGVDQERIQALWDFERSPLFDDAERTALSFARDAGSVPNAVTPDNYAELRKHFTSRQIIELLAAISIGGFLNRWNDTVATATDQETVSWAEGHLAGVGWSLGKHAGDDSEQGQHPRHSETAVLDGKLLDER